MFLCFQADETKVGALLPEMDRLLHKLMAKFVPLRLLRGQTDLREVKFDLRENQHDDANVAIGMAARTFMEEEDFGPAQQAKFIWYGTVSCTTIISTAKSNHTVFLIHVFLSILRHYFFSGKYIFSWLVLR